MASSLYESEYIPWRVPWDNQPRRDNGKDSSKCNSQRLLRLASLSSGLGKGTWGITIIRIDYKAPQQQLINALACINDAVQRDLGARWSYSHRRDGILLDGIVPPEAWPIKSLEAGAVRPADELFARYSLELLSRYDGLNEACPDTVRSKFQDWIVRMQGNPQGGDMRYVFGLILDADTIQQLHSIWCQRSRVAAAQTRVQVRVLDAVPGDECNGVYKVYLRGANGLVNFSRFGGLHQRDSRSALFEGYSGGDSSRRGGSPAGGYGYHSSSNTGSPSPYNSYSAYGNPNIGPGGGGGGPPGGYRSATPNQKGQYSDAVLNELESQNDAQVAGILGKVRTLKDMTVAIGDEIRDSSALAEKMNDTFDQTRLRLRGTMNRMLLMAQRSGIPWKVWLLFFLAVILIFTYVWLF
ncbi:hypothetical protein MY8738_009084 [Beauveria namnaoensis]